MGVAKIWLILGSFNRSLKDKHDRSIEEQKQKKLKELELELYNQRKSANINLVQSNQPDAFSKYRSPKS